MTTQTPSTTTTRRPARRARTAVVAAAALAVALFAGACNPESYQTSDMINHTRAQHGLHGLEFNAMLHMKAQAWAEHMSAQGGLSHSALRDGNWSETWTKLGENVGRGSSLNDVHEAFMHSAPHRANILDPAYNKVGTGVVRGADGQYWVVQEFMHEWQA